MTARLRKLLSDLSEIFWLIPSLMVVGAVLAAVELLSIDRSGLISTQLLASPWLYDGGGTGARTLLGTIASSTIGVAGTVFSITIAALSLAAGQMGPRLLHNFMRDRGNQITLGTFLGTFSYALVVLRSVRTQAEGPFVPHLALSIGVLLAFVCVGTLLFFVGHMAGRINVDTVIELVSDDVHTALRRLVALRQPTLPPPAAYWLSATPLFDPRSGYLQELDEDGLADWAMEHGSTIRMLVRRGDYVFPGAPIALILPLAEGADAAIRSATALSKQRSSSADAGFAIRQLVEVAVRALSPGINDPHTAMSVLDRLGAVLCQLAGAVLPSGVSSRDGRAVLVVPCTHYDSLVDVMFMMIRQNASGCAAVLIRLLEVLTAVASCEREETRIAALQRHADMVLDDAVRTIKTPADLDNVRNRHGRFIATRVHGTLAWVLDSNV